MGGWAHFFATLGGVVAEHRAVARLVRTEQNKLIYFANINIMIQEHKIVYICGQETPIKAARSR